MERRSFARDKDSGEWRDGRGDKSPDDEMWPVVCGPDAPHGAGQRHVRTTEFPRSVAVGGPDEIGILDSQLAVPEEARESPYACRRRSARIRGTKVERRRQSAGGVWSPTRSTYLRDQFYRLKARRGYKRAVVAVAHKILTAVYHMLSHRVCYHELGDLYLDNLNQQHRTRNLIRRLERLGYVVTLEQKAA